MSIATIPTFKLERELIAQGFQAIVGIDEAGCGALAGPVVAGAVIFPIDSGLSAVRDSKLMSEKVREELYVSVIDRASAWAVGMASVEEIYELGIRPANYLAMRRALELIEHADIALVDAWTIPGVTIPQRGIVKGDRTVKSIAAASIVAKVSRDRIMREVASQYPEYGFEIHKGYGTRVHRDAIDRHGPCPIHRLKYKTFSEYL